LDTDLFSTDNISSIIEDLNDNNSIIIKIIFDDIDDDQIRVVKLETLPPTRSEIPGLLFAFFFPLNFFNK